MAITHHQRAVGVFPTEQAVEVALEELREQGLPLNRVSIIARDSAKSSRTVSSDRVEVAYSGNKTGETVAAGVVVGGTLGGIAGLFVGLGTVLIPGVGPIVVGGTIATPIAPPDSAEQLALPLVACWVGCSALAFLRSLPGCIKIECIKVAI